MPNVTEVRGSFNDVVCITELRGGFPDVPIASDVDYAALIAGDDKPVFLTLPIGKAGATSGNQRHYDEAWLQEFERQTLEIKPVGLMGHLSEQQRSTDFPQEAIHWVGTLRQGDMLWGKGYVPPGQARDRIQRYKAQGKKIATSIDAFCDGIWDDKLSAYRMKPETLKLAQIDIAPADRAGIPALAALPHITKEMSDQQPTQQGQEGINMTDRVQVIREMTPADVDLIPQPVRAAVIATVTAPVEVAQIIRIRETLGLDGNADPVAAITEMRRVQDEQRKSTVTGKITELVKNGIKLETMRPLVTELITARNPATIQEAQAAYEAVIALDSVKAMLGGHVQEKMGPPQGNVVAGQQGQPRYFVIPAA